MSTCHATHDGALATSANAREFLSLKEVTVLADVPESRVRKDIETGLLDKPRVVCLSDTRLCFIWPHVFTFAAVYSNTMLTATLRKIALKKVSEYTISIDLMECWKTEDHSRDYYNNIYRSNIVKSIKLDRFLTLDLEQVCHSIGPRIGIYSEGLRRIEEKDDVLGGNAVFKGTRLSVVHIGKMAEDGEPVRHIIEDYPYLNENDVSFARLYFRAHPTIGRPKSAGEHKNAKATT